jgi:hypothetical protein
VNYEFAAQEQTVNHSHYGDGNCRKYAVKLTWKLELGIGFSTLTVHLPDKKQNDLAFHIFFVM